MSLGVILSAAAGPQKPGGKAGNPHKGGMAGPVKNVAQAAARVDAIFIPDSGEYLPDVVQTLTANGVNTKKVQLLGTGLWDDPRIYSVPAVDGGWYAAPEPVTATSRSAIAPATNRTRCAPQRSPTTRSR